MGRPANYRELGWGTAVQRILRRVVRDGDHRLWPVETRRLPQIRVAVGGAAWTDTVARVYWEAEVGPIPEGHAVGRTCDRRLCVAPAHHQVVESCGAVTRLHPPSCGLSPAELAQLADLVRGGATLVGAAEQLGVHYTTVQRLLRGTSVYVGGPGIRHVERGPREAPRCSRCHQTGHQRRRCTAPQIIPWEQAS